MKLEYIAAADAILGKCGRPQLQGGVSAVPFPKGFTMPMVLQPGASTTFVKEITGETAWVLRSITSDQASNSLTSVRCQVQLPNGRFLFGGNGIDVGQFCWIGSWKWLQDPELRCEPGQKIQVTLSDPTGALVNPLAVNFSFDGAYLFFMRGGEVMPSSSVQASSLPRYFGIVNENILAPVWMMNEALPERPGFTAEPFTYASFNPTDNPSGTTWTLTAGVISASPKPLPFEIPIDAGYEFWIRRILVDLQLTSTAAAVVLCKFRTGAGYILNDNFIDYARYLCGSEHAGYWKVKGTDSVFIDAALADISGTGNVTYQVFLEGVRWRKS